MHTIFLLKVKLTWFCTNLNKPLGESFFSMAILTVVCGPNVDPPTTFNSLMSNVCNKYDKIIIL
jgi:hypothetical protein